MQGSLYRSSLFTIEQVDPGSYSMMDVQWFDFSFKLMGFPWKAWSQATAAAQDSRGASLSRLANPSAQGRTRPTSRMSSSSVRGGLEAQVIYNLDYLYENNQGNKLDGKVKEKVIPRKLIQVSGLKPNAEASRSTVSSPFSSALTALKKEATVWSISKEGTSASTLERANFTQFDSLREKQFGNWR